MERSESIQNLAEALAKAQGEFKPAELNSVNPFLKNKYADLGAIIEASREPLSKNGLAVVQIPSMTDDALTITMTLLHASGEWIQSSLSLKVATGKGMTEAQSMGSTITYLRRYLWSSMLAIYTGDDSDGNEKTEKSDKLKQQAAKIVKQYDSDVHQAAPVEPPKELTPEEQQKLKDAINQALNYVDGKTKTAFETSVKPDKYSQASLDVLRGKMRLNADELVQARELMGTLIDNGVRLEKFNACVKAGDWYGAIILSEEAEALIPEQADDPRTGND